MSSLVGGINEVRLGAHVRYYVKQSLGRQLVLHLDNHVCCCSSIVTNHDPVSLHDLVQRSKKGVSLLHFSCSFFSPPVSGHKTLFVTLMKVKGIQNVSRRVGRVGYLG